MKRMALISDIHGNLEALNAVLSRADHLGCDAVFCCGDLVGYGPKPNEVIKSIQAHGIATVMGNYDEAVGFLLPACGCHIDNLRQKALSSNSLRWSIENTSAQNRAFLRSLPEELELEIEGTRLLIRHASADSNSEYIYEQDEERLRDLFEEMEQQGRDVYVYGHTHMPFFRHEGARMIVNAGSVGRPKDGDNRAAFVLLEVENGQVNGMVHRVKYDVEQVKRDIAASGLDDSFGEFLLNGGETANACGLDNHACTCGL